MKAQIPKHSIEWLSPGKLNVRNFNLNKSDGIDGFL